MNENSFIRDNDTAIAGDSDKNGGADSGAAWVNAGDGDGHVVAGVRDDWVDTVEDGGKESVDPIAAGEGDNWVSSDEQPDGPTTVEGADTLIGGKGDDSFRYIVGHGAVSIVGNDDNDQVIINGTDGQPTDFLVEDAASLNERTGAAVQDGQILVSANGVLMVTAKSIEGLTINTGASGDTVTIRGDFTSSGLPADGFTIAGNLSAYAVDFSGVTSAHAVTTSRLHAADTLSFAPFEEQLAGTPEAGSHSGDDGAWTDTPDLQDDNDATSGWTVSFDSGAISTIGPDYVEIVQDASGTISLGDENDGTFDVIVPVG